MTQPSNSTPTPTPETLAGTRVRNFVIAIVAIFLGAAIFLGLKTETAPGMLTALAEDSVPLEVALSNGKPTLMEFYANWCTSCQAMAPDLEALKAEHGEEVNFVMLNVDNSKWLPEILSYRVDGIPHFVFLDRAGTAIAQTVGEQPRTVMAENLIALANDSPLPHVQATGQTSAFSAPVSTAKPSQADPRSHGSQTEN